MVDNFDRALENAQTIKDEAFIQGIDMIRLQLLDILTRNGVVRIEAVGKQFDPDS